MEHIKSTAGLSQILVPSGIMYGYRQSLTYAIVVFQKIWRKLELSICIVNYISLSHTCTCMHTYMHAPPTHPQARTSPTEIETLQPHWLQHGNPATYAAQHYSSTIFMPMHFHPTRNNFKHIYKHYYFNFYFY